VLKVLNKKFNLNTKKSSFWVQGMGGLVHLSTIHYYYLFEILSINIIYNYSQLILAVVMYISVLCI